MKYLVECTFLDSSSAQSFQDEILTFYLPRIEQSKEKDLSIEEKVRSSNFLFFV